jgi:hypothetical protein
MTYDQWKTTNPQDAQLWPITCPVCKFKHYEHEPCLTPEPELETMLDKSKWTAHDQLFNDLKYDPKTNSQPMTSHRAFTICELAIYRFRDALYDKDDREYELLTLLVDEILSLRKSWQGK